MSPVLNHISRLYFRFELCFRVQIFFAMKTEREKNSWMVVRLMHFIEWNPFVFCLIQSKNAFEPRAAVEISIKANNAHVLKVKINENAGKNGLELHLCDKSPEKSRWKQYIRLYTIFSEQIFERKLDVHRRP